jgi:hypothetical protein
MELTDEQILELERQSALDSKKHTFTDEEILAMEKNANSRPMTNPSILGAVGDALQKTNPFAAGRSMEFIQDPKKQAQTAKAMGHVAYEVPNQASLGYMTPLLKKIGIPTPETRTSEKVAAGLVPIAGLGKLSQVGLLKRAPAAVKGAALGYAYNPSEDEVVDAASIKRVPGAVLGGAAPLAAHGVENVLNATVREVPFLNKFRNMLFQAKNKATSQFGQKIDELSQANPDRTISLRNAVENLNQEIANEPKLNSIVARSPKLRELADNPQLADNLTLGQSQEVLNEIKSKIPLGKLSGNVPSRPDDLPIYDLIDDIRGSQLDAFPEMAGVKKTYGKFAGNYDMIRRAGALRPGSTSKFLDVKKTGSGFSEPETKEAVKTIAPEAYRKAKGYRTAQAMLSPFEFLMSKLRGR